MSCQICSKTLGLKKSCKRLKERVKERRYRQKRVEILKGAGGGEEESLVGLKIQELHHFGKKKRRLKETNLYGAYIGDVSVMGDRYSFTQFLGTKFRFLILQNNVYRLDDKFIVKITKISEVNSL